MGFYSNNRAGYAIAVAVGLITGILINENKDVIRSINPFTKNKSAKKKITVLISGSGSNLQAIMDAIDKEIIPNAEIVNVISSSKNAYGLTRASNKGIPTQVHSLYPYYKGIPKEDKEQRKQKRIEYEVKLAEIINSTTPDIVVCAGWLLILGSDCLKKINKNIPIINLHPALPGAFDGTVHAIDMAYETALKIKKEKNETFTAGCMCHYVIEDVDKGEPIVIKKLDIDTDKETLEQYEERLHKAEHVAIVEATNKVLSNKK
ncbi:hypothetical protein FOG48_01419 [Hanseniaspora uvarum]|nr:hypothetical protein FOG48_01419 [Hanseniaspora uvarum]GMM41673.1 phosphoribosylglycinamide formyltransferase [Hanseniaspora uvarum]